MGQVAGAMLWGTRVHAVEGTHLVGDGQAGGDGQAFHNLRREQVGHRLDLGLVHVGEPRHNLVHVFGCRRAAAEEGGQGRL